MGSPLTPRQARVLLAIQESLEERGYPPTFRELASQLSVALGTVQDHVAALEAKGVLSRARESARSFHPAAWSPAAASRLPVLGRVPAGGPSEALEDADKHISVDKVMAHGADYALKVHGDSMEPEIFEGDLVLVRRADEAADGAVVIAHVDGADATVKRLRRKAREVWLEPANPRHRPITSPFRVVGQVVGLVRDYR